MYAALFLSLFLFAETPAATAEPVVAPPVIDAARPPRPKKEGGDRMVCRTEVKPNSRFTTKVCKTADEWEERTETARDALGAMQQRPTTQICGLKGCG